jgi:AraC-like DNA-binding protein
MRIILDASLKPLNMPEFTDYAVNQLTQQLAKRHELKGAKCLGMTLADGTIGVQQGFVSLLSLAYSRHRKIEIAPHDLWFIVLGDLARHVNMNSSKFRHLFTRSAEKQTILVSTDDVTQLPYDQVITELKGRVPSDMSAFIPTLSTMGESENMAMHAMFCDMVKTYYSYMTFCCGIPEVKVTGTKADWEQLCSMSDRVADLCNENKLNAYMKRVKSVFASLRDLSDSEIHTQWMRSIFTAKNVGSGGQLEIDGWIRELFLENTSRRLEAYQFSTACVPYENANTGRKFSAVVGGFSRCLTSEQFLSCQYEQIIYE